VFLGGYLVLLGSMIVAEYALPLVPLLMEQSPVVLVAEFVAPMTAIFLVVFFIIFEGVCNAFAEITLLADREFYLDFWNSTTFTEFSRTWNTPVHEFLLRHIFLGLQEDYGFSGSVARVVTFLVSFIMHEAITFGMFGLMTPWLAIFSVLQFPLMGLMRSSHFKGKRAGNLFFWTGLLLGLPIISVLYAREYCFSNRGSCVPQTQAS